LETYRPEELIEKFGSAPWISPYQKIIATYDKPANLIEIHEFHARGRCIGGSAWEIYHYPRVSPLVVKAEREGARNIFQVKIGSCNLKLIPSIAAAGIESAEVNGDEIKLTYTGLGGGGVAATICRGMAEGVKRVQVYERGGGGGSGKADLILPLKHKIIIGIDDTDKSEAGATWSLGNELALRMEEEGIADYLRHSIIQLYTQNPHKTTNCVSIALTFAVEPRREEQLIERFKQLLQENTLSKDTGMAVYNGVNPPNLKAYAIRAKTVLVEAEETKEVAEKTNVRLIEITGERGLIGALAAIWYANTPDESVKVLTKPE